MKESVALCGDKVMVLHSFAVLGFDFRGLPLHEASHRYSKVLSQIEP
jgi:hypothetical protein